MRGGIRLATLADKAADEVLKHYPPLPDVPRPRAQIDRIIGGIRTRLETIGANSRNLGSYERQNGEPQ